MLALLATTALVAPPAALGLSEARAQAAPAAQAPQPQPPSAPRFATRNVGGLVILDDPTKVRPGGWPAFSGIDASKAPIFARSAAFNDALKPFLGQGISIELFNRLIAATVLAARNAGYPVVDVIVPEQDVDNGTVQVLVVVGRLGKVTAEGNKWFKSADLTGGVRLKAGDPIRSDLLNADLAWLNNNPFRSIDSVFVPSQQPGATDIVLKTTDRFPLRTYAGFANDGVQATGEQRGSVGFSWGDAFWLGQPFFDDPDAKFAKDQTVSFVHFGVYYSPTIAPDAGEAFTVFFKESLRTPPPKNFEEETPLPMLTNRSYPIAFGMLYQTGGVPATVASLAAISPAAGGPGTVQTAGADGIPGYARISSFDVAPDAFSAINRPLYMDIQNPRTEEQLGYELRPTLQARVDAPSAEALAAIEPAGPGAFSCARLPETLALLDNPELAQHLRDLCAKQGQQNLPEVPARPVRYFRPVR
ncbi:MAG: POTRA domain-containing protein [Acidobacteriota bacterium]